jgi:hypothetical protein
LRSGSPPEPAAPSTSPWESLYRHATPAQQLDLLTLAGQQGLLYGHQLPPASHRPTPAAEEPHTWNLLGKMLAGQVAQLEPIHLQSFTPVDTALDSSQRRAVAAALATTDLCLIQGLPGTGKSRVLLEILTQAALRGDRVLFLAAYPAALDRVLEQAGQRQALCPVRCVAPEEAAGQLPAAVRAWTLTERAGALRDQSVVAAKQARDAAEMQCARRRHEDSIWPRLAELVAELQGQHSALVQAEAQLASVEAEVRAEVEAAPETAVAREVQALRQTQQQQLEDIAGNLAIAQQQHDTDRAKLAALDQEIASLAPLAAAKHQAHWWSGTWWRALFKGDVVGRVAELQQQKEQLQSSIDGQEKRLQELTAARTAATDQADAQCRARLQGEIDHRRQRCQVVVDQALGVLRRSETAWDELCCQIEAVELRPAERTADALEAARQRWQLHRQQDEARCALLRDWSGYLESSADSLAARLPGLTNVVAATPTGLAADPYFSDAAASGGQFDLLVVDEADHLAEADFLKVARRARSWVLLGEPPLTADTRQGNPEGASRSRPPAARGLPAVAARGQYFHRLWEHLHCDPSLLPYAWFREGERIGCRLRQLAPEQRQGLEREPLADAPDVELRILALPRMRPVLAEVLFPALMDAAQAKEFLFRELQELTVQTRGRSLRWTESSDNWNLHFEPAVTDGSEISVVLDRGIREILIAGNPGNGDTAVHTCRLEFERSSGWDQASAEQWVEEHLGLRDLGRTAALEIPYRMAPALTGVISDLLFAGAYVLPPTGPAVVSNGPAVEFVAVPAPGKGKSGGQGRAGEGRGSRKNETAAGGLPTTGGGLELDLAAPRHSDRLPSELRHGLPNRGFVNYLEARVVVRKLEDLHRKPEGCNGSGTPKAAPTAAVIALFAAQAELIRQLIKLSPVLAPHAGAIPVGVPATFRQREAEVVVLSLTRSHTHRAVAYGDGPAALVLALTRAQRQVILVGDPGNLVRRSHWQGVLDHLDEAAAQREGQILGQLVRYLQGQGLCKQAFRFCEGSVA